MNATIKVSLMAGAAWQPTEDGQLQLQTPPVAHRPPLKLAVTPTLKSALMQLVTPVASSELIAQALQQEGMAGMAKLNAYLMRLNQFGCLDHTLFIGDVPVATYRPLAMYGRFQAGRVKPKTTYRLSRFAYLRRVDGEWCLECPKGHAAMVGLSPMAMTALHALATGHDSATLATTLDGSVEAATLFLDLLANAHALTEAEADPEITDAAQLPWDFHDLLFHSRSRLGRHANPFGGTYPFQGRFAALPVIKPPMSDTPIPLYRPDLDDLAQHDFPFTAVMEQRQSVREYDVANPIGVEQLGEWLYRSVRVKSASEEKGVSFRVYPGGGALHELEIYAVIQHCAGLDTGVYHYDPLHHALHRLSDLNLSAQTLIQMYSATAKLEQPLQVALVLTARFQRLQFKYQSMTYAAILKHIGVVYEALYLVATAMKLAPCALGGGHADLFGQIAKLDPWQEASVGEFLIGSRATSQAEDSRTRIAQALQAATTTGQSWGVK